MTKPELITGVQGRIDALQDGRISGWAIDPQYPVKKENLQLTLFGEPVVEFSPQIVRDDVLEALNITADGCLPGFQQELVFDAVSYGRILDGLQALDGQQVTLDQVLSIKAEGHEHGLPMGRHNLGVQISADGLAQKLGIARQGDHRRALAVPGMITACRDEKLWGEIYLPRTSGTAAAVTVDIYLFDQLVGQVEVDATQQVNSRRQTAAFSLPLGALLDALGPEQRAGWTDKAAAEIIFARALSVVDARSKQRFAQEANLRQMALPPWVLELPKEHRLQLGETCLEFTDLGNTPVADPAALTALRPLLPLGDVAGALAEALMVAGADLDAPISVQHHISTGDETRQAGFDTRLGDLLAQFDLTFDAALFEQRRPRYRQICEKIWGEDRSLQQAELYLSSLRPTGTEAADVAGLCDIDLLRKFFDTAYYLRQYGENIGPDTDPVEHYLISGRSAGLTPHPLFSQQYLAEQLGSAAPVDSDLFLYFLRHGRSLDLDPHPLFSASWYRKKYDLSSDHFPWQDYVSGGWACGREPNSSFLASMALAPVQASAGRVKLGLNTPPAVTYMESSLCAEQPAHPFALSRKLDRAAYLRHMAKHKTLFGAPYFQPSRHRKGNVVDYLLQGEARGVAPNMAFLPDWYRQQYGYASDLIGPLVHFLSEGERLGRKASPIYDPQYYASRNVDVLLHGVQPFGHFLNQHDKEPRRRPSARMDTVWLAENAPAGMGTLTAFKTAIFTTPQVFHPALSASQRVTQSDIVSVLQADTSDRRALPAGLRSVFGGTTVGEVMQEIEAYEAATEAWSARDSGKLRATGQVRTQYECFDDRRTPELLQSSRKALQGVRKPPLVSVIMPVRNRATVIGEAVRSVLSQSYQNLEFLLVDDGSTDGTTTVAQGVADVMQDTRLRVITRPATGVSAARNVGLEQAKGKYIAYLDSDNTWEAEYLTLMIGQLIQQPDISLAHAALRIFTPNKGTIRYRGEPYNQKIMSRENFIDMNVLVHHRRVIEAGLRFDESLLRCVDWDFIYRGSQAFTPSEYIPIVGCNYLDDSDALGRITTNELVGDYYRLASRQMDITPYVTGSAPQHKPQASLIWPLHRADEQKLEADIWRALHHLKRGQHEVIIIANGLSDKATAKLVAMSERMVGLRVIHLPRSFMDTPAVTLAAPLAQAERLLLWSSHVSYDAQAVSQLIQRGLDSAAPIIFPLVLDQKGQCEDGLFTLGDEGQGVIGLMAGQKPPSGMQRLTGVGNAGFPVLLSTAAFQAQGGFDFSFSLGLGLSAFVVQSWASDPKAVELHLDVKLQARSVRPHHGVEKSRQREAAAFQHNIQLPAGIRPQSEAGALRHCRPLRAKVHVAQGRVALAPQYLPVISRRGRPGGLRIQINCPAPDDATKGNWGDLHYAESLAAAFSAAGQTPTICLRDYWKHQSDDQDVVLHIRGIVDIQPVRQSLNLVWLISHPEKPTAAEFGDVDMVISSSQETARTLHQRFDITSPVLPQATDPQRFAFQEDIAVPKLQDKFLFVGNSRRQHRRIIMDALRGNLPLEVYGQDWENFLPPHMIKGRYLPNAELAPFYRSAGAVLNDHWPTMADYGIISNRLYDVVASGGVAISDPVEGIADTFGAHVQIVSSENELEDLARHIGDWAPSQAARRDKSREILADHSFERRAQQILALINEL